MTYQEPLGKSVIALSISESPDMDVLGLGKEHLEDAMAEVARHLLAMGARLLYGGDLRPGGFSELLFELVARHRRDADIGDEDVGIRNVLAWPVHVSLTAEAITKVTDDLFGIAEVICLTSKGEIMKWEDRASLTPHHPAAAEWTEGLTSMRRQTTAMSHARVVLGGKVTDFKGCMPGIAEEALASLEMGQPIFILGGFGGCARDIVHRLGFEAPTVTSRAPWNGEDQFDKYGPGSLNNGLTDDENQVLARTVHIDQAMALILRGLLRQIGIGQPSTNS